jgi:hypothetical protein
MVETVVVKEALSHEMITAGAELTQKLDEQFVVKAALWLLLPETGTWRFIVCIPEADKQGPKKVYSTIQKLLRKGVSALPDISLTDISVLSPKDPLIQLLRTAMETGSGISAVRFSRNTISGHFIEDAYVYRMHFAG